MEVTQSDNGVLQAAEGWLELGDFQSASDELDKLPPAVKASPDVIWLRVRIYQLAGKWSYVEAITRGLHEADPKNPRYIVALSQSLQTQGKAKEGFWLVVRHLQLGSLELYYQAACGACGLGMVRQARIYLDEAIACGRAVGQDIRLKALDDPLLEPLWQQSNKTE